MPRRSPRGPGRAYGSEIVRRVRPGGDVAGSNLHGLTASRATDSRGRTQPIAPRWNPSGYLWNVIDQVRVRVDGS